MDYRKKQIIKITMLNILERFIPLSGDKEKRVKLVELFAKYYSTQVVGKYADDYLEKILCDIGRDIRIDFVPQFEKGTVLHIMTAASRIGGHTRVVDNWIKFDSGRQHSVVFTDSLEGRKVMPAFLDNTVRNSGGKVLFLNGTSYIEKAKKLLKIASQYEKVIIHTHMYDPLPILTFSNKKWNRTIYHFNHADYRFWLGVSIADVCLQISQYDLKISKKLRDVRTNQRLDIPIDNAEFGNKEREKIRKEEVLNNVYNDEYIVTTMASGFKYNPLDDYNFFDFVETLLESNNKIVFVAIGPDRADKNWKRLINKFNRRIRVMGVLEKEKVEEILLITDLYVNSFPLGSYTSCLDAAAKGIKVVGVDIDGQMVDSLRMNTKKTPNELVQYINDILNGKVEYVQNQLKHHLKDEWCKQLEKIYKIEPTHTIHSFAPKMRLGLYEEIVQRTFDARELDMVKEIPLELGIWYNLFKLLEMTRNVF